MSKSYFVWVLLFLFPVTALSVENTQEVLRSATKAQMVKRVHPVTKQTFFSIVESGAEEYPMGLERATPRSRPDYRLLERDADASKIYYDGPVSDRKKIYLFAGTVAAVGTVAGTAGLLAAASSTATTGAAGGAGAYAAGGTAVLSGVAGTVAVKSKPDTEQAPYIHEATSIQVPEGITLSQEKKPETKRII